MIRAGTFALSICGLAAALFLAACPAPEPFHPAVPPPGPTCASWCDHARALGCAAAAPTPGGAPCETVCGGEMASVAGRLDLGCRTAAPSCPAADACEALGPPL